MELCIVPETASIKVLGYKFDSLLMWESHIGDMLDVARQRTGQLYRCHSLLTNQGLINLNILYLGAATTLRCLDNWQSWIKQPCTLFSNHSSIIRMPRL